MLTFYKFPKDYPNDLEAFGPAQAEFLAGNIDPIRFRAIRVGYGIYEQRKDNTYMVRIRCAGAGITPHQLAHAADVSARYAADHLHVTTRFEMQMHNVDFDDLLPVMRKLTEVGLSTRGGGGNTIRNITAATDSGVEKGEVFDVTPYAMALTTRMINEKDSFSLPRKFKIAFSNTEKDTAIGSLMDLGFIAQIRDGRPGFRVFVAGGMGAKSMAGKLLEEFIPADQVYATTKALKLMYDQHGNRKNKFINRIRFLWEKLGEEKFRAFYQEELAKVLKDSPQPLELPELVNEGLKPEIPVEQPEGGGFVIWKTRYVKEQNRKTSTSVISPQITWVIFTTVSPG